MLRTNERGDVTEFTIGNVVVDLGGRLVTPPVDCGLLEVSSATRSFVQAR